jgi:hypothetical protein
MKAEGKKSGMLDLCLPVANEKYHALYIEMKWGKNDLSIEQKQWVRDLVEEGNAVAKCWSFDEAKEVIKDYLENNYENL